MTTSAALPGARIGKYRLLAHIATGGMGRVYRAKDEELGRLVALKVLAPEYAQNPTLVERFLREARHAAKLAHKNIVTLYDSGQADGFHFLAMEYIHGFDLGEYIRRQGQLDPEESRRILIQACKALEHAASQGITHRDIKPSNFLLANEHGRCRVKLTDLGLARMVNDEEFRVTRAGTTVGTVDYMAPEQSRDSALADVRSDIYGLGCTFYHMLAGQPPFCDGGLGERIYKHMAVEPPDVRLFNPRVSAGLWTVLRRMLAKHPDDRFQSPTELIQALRSIPTIAQSTDEATPNPDTDSDSDPDSDSSLETLAGSAESAPLARRQPTPTPHRLLPPTPSEVAPEASPPQAPAPDPPPARRRTKRRTTVPEMVTVPDEPAEAVPVSPEQRQAAAGQFERASEVIRDSGDPRYALQLLLSCCNLDPCSLLYRKTLREVGRTAAGGKKGGWFGSLTNLPARGRFKSARAAGDHRKALEHGEELLTRNPDDLATQIDLADSAESLGLHALAAWMLEEACHNAPGDLTALRALAELYERQKRLRNAVAVWEQIRKADPHDLEAGQKIKDLSASDTIARGNFENFER